MNDTFKKINGEIYQKVDDLTGYREDLQSQINTLTAQVSDYETAIDGIVSSKAQAEAQLKDLQDQLSSLDVIAPEK